jgi:hypothetical protein
VVFRNDIGRVGATRGTKKLQRTVEVKEGFLVESRPRQPAGEQRVARGSRCKSVTERDRYERETP